MGEKYGGLESKGSSLCKCCCCVASRGFVGLENDCPWAKMTLVVADSVLWAVAWRGELWIPF